MSGTSLYALSNDYLALLEKLADADLDAVTVADTIESTGIVDEFRDKAIGVVSVMRHYQMRKNARKAEIERLQECEAKEEKIIARVNAYLLGEMQRTGITRIEGPLFTISVRANAQAVDVFEPGLIPKEYMRVPPVPDPVPDKKAISEAIKAGLDVPGARLVRGSRVAIT